MRTLGAVHSVMTVGAAVAFVSAACDAHAEGTGPKNAPSSPLDHYYLPAPSGGDPPPAPSPLRRTRYRHDALEYSSTAPTPEGYRVERTWQSRLIKPSAFTFATSYLISLSVAAASDFQRPNGFLAIPVAGPFMAIPGNLANTNCGGTLFCFSVSDEEAVRLTGLIFDGLTQLVSASLLVISVSAPTFEFRRERVGKLEVVPLHLQAGYGLGLRGVY